MPSMSKTKAIENPAQVVKYSAKFVERLSDIVSNMNISKSAAIKKGTIEVHGNANSIDEDKIKASDINLVVSVQVVNQTTTVKDDAKFSEIKDVEPGTQAFTDAYGDCYISGFVEGGDFSSIISIRCLDRSKTTSVIRTIKSMTKTESEPEDFTMDSYSLDNMSASASDALKDTEMTISVSWMGGGQIKDSKTNWDIDSVYKAAAAFPSSVAQTPQKTWAILTKYKANRSFNELAMKMHPLDYEPVLSYTADLFNNFMEYKHLIKQVQDIISNSDQYKEVDQDRTPKSTPTNINQNCKGNPIPIDISTLVAVRNVMRNEMNKIVAVINILSKKPHLLTQSSFDDISPNRVVQAIIDEAKSKAPAAKFIHDSPPSTKAQELFPSAEAPSSKSTEGRNQKGKAFNAQSPADESNVKTYQPVQTSPSHDTNSEGIKIDLSSLIAPEIWAELLPVRKVPLPINSKDGYASKDNSISPVPKNYGYLSGNDVEKQVTFGHGVSSNRFSCTFNCNDLLVLPSDTEPFLSFDNGISFWFHHDGNFAVYTEKGQPGQRVEWESSVHNENLGNTLRFHEDGNLCCWCYRDGVNHPSWSTKWPGNKKGKLLLSNKSPYVEIFNVDDQKVWDNTKEWHSRIKSDN